MAESIVNVTEGSGKKLHTFQRTIGVNAVEDEVILHGEPYLASYLIGTGSGISVATAASHVLQIMAGGSLRVYLRRLMIYQVGLATTAGVGDFALLRLTSAGTGGTVVTPNPMDPADAASGCAAMTLPTVKGTEGVGLWRGELYFQQTLGTGEAGPAMLLADIDFDRFRIKPPIIAAGTTNGLALKAITGNAAASVTVLAYVSEANF